MNRFALVLVILLALVVPAGASADSSLDSLASSLAGQPVTVECDDAALMDGASGYVWTLTSDNEPPWFESTIHLAGEYCGWIHYAQVYAGSRGRVRRFASALDNPYWIGSSLLLLQHEALHIRLQSTDEGVVECAAIRNVWNVARRFGFGRRLLRDVYQGARDAHASQHGSYASVC